MNEVTIEYILSHHNINEEVYACDVRRWLGIEDYKKIHEVQKVLSEIKSG